MSSPEQDALFREALRIGGRSRMTGEDSSAGLERVPAAVQVHNDADDAHHITDLVLLYNIAKL